MRYVAGMRAALRPREKLPREQMDTLAVKASSDQTSRDELVTHCMGLIAAAARRHRNTLGEDAFGEASVALLEAVDSFDPEVGDFRTWAACCMWVKLHDAARREAVYGSRFLPATHDNVGVEADLGDMPELLFRAVADGKVTRRQARIVVSLIAGRSRGEIMAQLGVSRMTYYRELQRAMEGMSSYVR